MINPVAFSHEIYSCENHPCQSAWTDRFGKSYKPAVLAAGGT